MTGTRTVQRTTRGASNLMRNKCYPESDGGNSTPDAPGRGAGRRVNRGSVWKKNSGTAAVRRSRASLLCKNGVSSKVPRSSEVLDDEIDM
jgi:hypothetical protein